MNTSNNDKLESIVDIKKRLWQQIPGDKKNNVKTLINFELENHTPIGQPGSFLISKDHNIYINDNTYGKLFRIPPDFQTIEELGPVSLENPTKLRESNNKLFVYDNTGINVLDKNGGFIRRIKPFLKIEDFDLLNDESYVVSLAEIKSDDETSSLVVLDATGKRVGSLGKVPSFNFPDIENRTFVEIKGGKAYVCYKYDPRFEVYDLEKGRLLYAFEFDSSIFKYLKELKENKDFANPEPGRFKIPKFTAGVRISRDRFYVLLHTPNIEIIEFTLDGIEVMRHTTDKTLAMEYFGFDIKEDGEATQFFIGIIDYSGNASLMVFEPK